MESGAAAHSRRVLVVDDDPDWREFLRESLQELGYEAVEAASGQEALERLGEQNGCSVMLLDLLMPEMSGEEVVARLPEEHPKIVFLTSADAQQVGPALRTGAHYYLPKGASLEQLSLMLDSLDS